MKNYVKVNVKIKSVNKEQVTREVICVNFQIINAHKDAPLMMVAQINAIKFMITKKIFHIIVGTHINAKTYVIFVIRNVQRIYLIIMMNIFAKKMMVVKKNVFFVIRNVAQRIMIMTMMLKQLK